MLTLDKKSTALLKAALCTNNTLVYLFLDTETISSNEYESIREDFSSWKVAYESGDLYGTNANDSTFQFTGIDQFPIPPQR